MRAHLARHARRALVRRGLPVPPPARCLHTATPNRPMLAQTTSAKLRKRTFFGNLLQKPPRDVRETQYEPGWMQIMIWRSRMLDNLRPLPRKELLQAWNKLMDFKLAAHRPLSSTQALQCQRLLDYLINLPRSKDGEENLSLDHLDRARRALEQKHQYETGEAYIDLARLLCDAFDLPSMRKKAPGEQKKMTRKFNLMLLKTLARNGAAHEAKARLVKLPELCDQVLPLVSRGLADEESPEAILELQSLADTAASTTYNSWRSALFSAYAKAGQVAEAKAWFPAEDITSYYAQQRAEDVVNFARSNGEEKWLWKCIQDILKEPLFAEQICAVMAMVLEMGRPLKEVEAMRQRFSTDTRPIPIDISYINFLMRAARFLRSDELANEITDYAASHGIAPDAETFLIWMQIKVYAGDLKGAKYAFDQLKDHITSYRSYDKIYDVFTEALGQYILLHCRQRVVDVTHLAALHIYMDENHIRLDPSVAAVLTTTLLRNEQIFDTMDILACHAFMYSAAERLIIQTAFLDFVLDESISTARVRAGYQVLSQYFQDLPVPHRVQCMQAFFDRGRPDIATQVFGHMRNHRNKAYHPNEDIYVQCLEGLARDPNLEATERIHRFVRTDTSLQPTTRLFTAVMNAYTAADRSMRALDYWQEIIESREGPGYDTLAAVFWALEKRMNGADKARAIWERITRMDIDVPPLVYSAYAAALAGSGHEVEVQKIILNMVSYVGSEPDIYTLGLVHNAFPHRDKQKAFEAWAKMRYRDTWEELCKKGRRMTEYSLCQFKIPRPLKA